MISLLLFSALAAMVVFLWFRHYFRDVATDHPLTGSLIPAAMLTTLIYYQNSRLPGLAIAMIAILAFIHYRSVIKDMSDVICVFWSILTGILIGAGLTWGTLGVNLFLAGLGLAVLRYRAHRITYLLLICFEETAREAVEERLKSFRGIVCSHRQRGEFWHLELKVKLRHVSLEAIDRIAEIEGVDRALLISEKRRLTKA